MRTRFPKIPTSDRREERLGDWHTLSAAEKAEYVKNLKKNRGFEFSAFNSNYFPCRHNPF